MIRVVLLAALAAIAWDFRGDLLRYFPSAVATSSAHEQYAAAIRGRGLDRTDLGRRWLQSAAESIARPHTGRAAFTHAGTFSDDREPAAAWRFTARRGQRITASLDFASGDAFIDLIDVDGNKAVASGTAAPRFSHDIDADGEFILRVQPELLRAGPYRVTQITRASLEFPLRGVSMRAVQSVFGDPRNGGSRRHEGIDIFAPRGTAAVAAVDGWITGSTTNRLGGNVVWLWSPARRLSLYYAHLDRQAVARGERVRAGEVVGYVGNTGNARSTSPHLHFGIYARGEGAIDPGPFVVDPTGGERLMHQSDGKSVRNQ